MQKEEFLNLASKGCLPLIFKQPISLEPPYSDTSLERYNRNPKEIAVLKVIPSALDEISSQVSELFLNSLRGISEPVSFEIIGSGSTVRLQIVVQKRDRRIVESALGSLLRNTYLEESKDILLTHYARLSQGSDLREKMEFQFNDYYLAPPFYFPLQPSKDFSGDPLDSLYTAFSQLRPEELGFFQVLFIPAKSNWAKLARHLIGYRVKPEVGKEYHPYLSDPQLQFHKVKALEKIADGKPFYAVILRIGLFTYKGKATGVLKTLGSALNTLTSGDRPFRFLTREDYYRNGVPEKLQYYMFFNRVSLRPGMLLTTPELSALVHLPSEQTLEKGYPIETAKGRRPAPDFLTAPERNGIILGEVSYRGKTENVILTHRERVRHCHIIGTQGSGKSTLIANCVLQDIAQGTGVCVIDPHGDLIDRSIIPKIPSHLLEKVIYFDPLSSPLSLNILEARDEEERTVIADDVVSIFKRLSDTWGVQMDEILSFGVSAILSNKDGGDLGTLYTFLTNDGFREKYLKNVEDEFVAETWRNRFTKLPETAIAPVLRRLTRFLRDPVLRKIVSNKKSSIDFRRIMDEGNVLLVKLPLGKVGTENAYMLGSLIISKLHAAALTREDIPEEKRRPFYLFADEFQNFICKSVEESIYGTRKFNLGLVLAHHTLQQLWSRDKDVAEAVLAARTRICFHVGDEDASVLARGFSTYTPDDLQNLGNGEAIVRVGGSVNSFQIKTRYEPPLSKEIADKKKEELIRSRRERYTVDAYRQPETTGEPIPFHTCVDESLIEDQQGKREKITETGKDGENNIQKIDGLVLRQNENRFLEFLAEGTELLPIREIYSRLKLGGKSGDKIKNTLLEMGLIAEAEINLRKSKRKPKILTLTPKGYQGLQLPLPQGKGGSLHQYLQKFVAECARKRGYEANIEEQAPNGKLVDVGLAKDGNKTAVEVSVTTRPDQVLQNIELDLNGGYSRVIVVFTDIESLAETRTLTFQKLGESEVQRISFCLADEFEEEL
jgi:hypothetical protein